MSARHRTTLAQALQRAWQRRGPVACLLYPLSLLAQRVTDAKRRRYATHPTLAYEAPIPVVVVGNLYVGGTGKTPLLITLVNTLRTLGWHPGVVSRGYGAKLGDTPRVGQGNLDPQQFGDEPSLIAASTGAPIGVHPHRSDAIKALLVAHPHLDVILSDDGLQHRAIARDIEILVEDDRGIGNGWVLPAGPLRESPRVRGEVDAIVVNGADVVIQGPPRETGMRVSSGDATRLLDGTRMSLKALSQTAPSIAAAAGIGRPDRFFDGLRAAGITLQATLALPDHYDYQDNPFASMPQDIVLLTEKDAVKCRHLKDPRLWAVSATARLADPEFFDWLHRQLLAARERRLTDTLHHGQTPA